MISTHLTAIEENSYWKQSTEDPAECLVSFQGLHSLLQIH